MKYFFILGSNPTLSIAEISAVFSLVGEKKLSSNNSARLTDNALILETSQEINAKDLIKKLGGTIKIGVINCESLSLDKDKLLDKTIKIIEGINKKGKFHFGISYYGGKKFNEKPLAMEIKKYLRENGISSRWVVSREPVLSSVVVEQNGLADDGIEIVLLKDGEKVLIGKTLAVQPFKELSFRDYGRPARDDYSGMLPPKLAQIMINLAISPSPYEGEGWPASPKRERGEGGVKILDPFCGSGTILTEAMLMGYKNVTGSDISPKAVENTKKNIEWTRENFECRISNVELFNRSVFELSMLIKPNSIDAIVTEPYLGPQRGKFDINKIKKELEILYSKSLIKFKEILKPQGRIVMIWPSFTLRDRVADGGPVSGFISPNLNEFKIINPIPKNLKNDKFIKLTKRNTIVYGRPNQRVWREIVILEK